MLNMETESMRSGRSWRSDQPRSNNVAFGNLPRGAPPKYGPPVSITQSPNPRYRPPPPRGPRSLVDMRTNGGGGAGQYSAMSGTETEFQDDRIEVQILPQDDNWCDNTTAITSETAFSMGDTEMYRWGQDCDTESGFSCRSFLTITCTAAICFLAFISPIIMVILPRFNITDGSIQSVGGRTPASHCSVQCESQLISLGFKLLILLLGTWALFFRGSRATLPRIFLYKSLVLFLVFLICLAFWLFYIVRIYQVSSRGGDDGQNKTSKKLASPPPPPYDTVVDFASNLVDALLFIHYLAVVLIEIRQLQCRYVVRIVRSPDGESQTYNVGQLSIQRCAAWCLEQYYTEFPAYNPYLELASARKPQVKMSTYKFYDVDGITSTNNAQTRSRAIFAAQARRRDASSNDRYYVEEEYERRLKKRRARLLTAAEEAFGHIKRLQEDKGAAVHMDPAEAAQAIFPSLARSLQKYLRITRQQPKYHLESILDHLSTCIAHDMGPKSFVEKYLKQGPVIMNDKEYRPIQSWSLFSNVFVSRAIQDGTLFQLRQGDVSLLVSVRRLPIFHIKEEMIDPKHNRFVLRLNSETSV